MRRRPALDPTALEWEAPCVQTRLTNCEAVETGTTAAGWQTARLEDKLLTGTEPRELPVERIKLQFVIYLKTTQALGLTIALAQSFPGK